jgi:hypothetical protein
MRVIIRGVTLCALLLTAVTAVSRPASPARGVRSTARESAGAPGRRAGFPGRTGGRALQGRGGEKNRKQEPRAGRKSAEDGPIRSPQEPVGCDAATGYLDFAVIDTLELEGAHLIIIARLGTGETSRRLNQHRLRVVEEYVRRRGSGLKYVLAEGRKVEGLGRVELYVGGRLLHILPLRKNAKGFCLPGQY